MLIINEQKYARVLTFTEAQKAEFWSRVDRQGSHYLWPNRNPHGRPVYWLAPDVLYAQRVALIIATGMPEKEGLLACHTCPIEFCVAPHHLYWGTAQDNADDAVRDGTSAKVRIVGGAKHARARLTAEQACDVFKAASLGETFSALAKTYSVDVSTIANVVHKKHYIGETAHLWSDYPQKQVNIRRGAQHHGAKVTLDQAIKIKEGLLLGESIKSLSDKHGVAYSNVAAIKSGHAWKWVIPSLDGFDL